MQYQKEIAEKYSKEEISEMLDNVNGWRWDDRLGEKPCEDFDDLPRYNIHWWHKLMKRRTKKQYLQQVQWNLQSCLTAKEYYHHLHTKNLGCSEEKFEAWWRRCHMDEKFLGCYKESNDGN